MKELKKAKSLLLYGGQIYDVGTGNRKALDIIIVDGKIDRLGEGLSGQYAGEKLDITGQIVAPGLLDMHVHLREPGREDEETIESGCASAMAGGVTAVCAMPNTHPPCDSQEVVRFLKKRGEELLVDVLPVACISKKREGKELTEMAELVKSGAVAFSDDGSPVRNAAVMRRALEYSSMYEVPVIEHCEDPDLVAGGHMHEGWMSTRLGMAGMPDIGEAVMVARNVALAEYTGGHIHIAHISTAKSVESVRRAKENGVKVTCEVTPHHLVLTDEALINYDTNLKMNPPLRSRSDVQALLVGLRDGTIDAIASDHAPHSIEEKDVEFAAAPFGILGVETMLGIILARLVATGELRFEEALRKMIVGPRQVLGLPVPKIKEGEIANFAIFQPEGRWIVQQNQLHSLSRNMPYDGWELQGPVLAAVNRGYYWTAGL
jgi:dihydroorotase